MQYETLLFTRNQREDFTAFIRPSLMTNKDISDIGGIFNYVTDISRLTAEFPSLYGFPLGEYLLLLRHYNSGRKHAGRAIGVIEGIAVRKDDVLGFTKALPHFIEYQSDLLNVIGTLDDIETQTAEASAEQTWSGSPAAREPEDFTGDFLSRRDADRLFLPFTAEGRDMLIGVLADSRFSAAPYFAFGTNSDVLTQLERRASVDVVSFFKTESASFRNRKTNRVSKHIGEDNEATHPTMMVRPGPARRDEMSLRPERSQAEEPDEPDEQEDEDTLVGSDAISLRTLRLEKPRPVAKQAQDRHRDEDEDEDEDAEPTVLTMRQMRDRTRERERAEAAEASSAPDGASSQPNDPIHWLLRLISSIVSPGKPK